MKRQRTPKPLSTAMLDRVVYEAIVPAYSALSRFGSRRSLGNRFWAEARRAAVARIHHTTAPQRRHKAAEVTIEELIRVVGYLTERVRELNIESTNLKVMGCGCGAERRAIANLQQELGDARSQVAQLSGEAARLREEIANKERILRQLRAQQPERGLWGIALSPLEERIVLLMGETGLGRSWRIKAHFQQQQQGGYRAGSVRNALRGLQAKGVVKEMMELGRVASWSGPRGGGRAKLLLLSDIGAWWFERLTGEKPRESELIWAQRMHRGVTHGVAILEVADYLRAMDMPVEMEPNPLYEAGNTGWGRRAQPDLITYLDDEPWPVEVQRKVAEHPRYREKWAKALRAAGRLMLVLFTEEKLAAQRAILRRWARRPDWPAGEVWLGSLEGMMQLGEDWWFEPLK